MLPLESLLINCPVPCSPSPFTHPQNSGDRPHARFYHRVVWKKSSFLLCFWGLVKPMPLCRVQKGLHVHSCQIPIRKPAPYQGDIGCIGSSSTQSKQVVALIHSLSTQLQPQPSPDQLVRTSVRLASLSTALAFQGPPRVLSCICVGEHASLQASRAATKATALSEKLPPMALTCHLPYSSQ